VCVCVWHGYIHGAKFALYYPSVYINTTVQILGYESSVDAMIVKSDLRQLKYSVHHVGAWWTEKLRWVCMCVCTCTFRSGTSTQRDIEGVLM
jgi:hypothetical protein